MTATLRGLALGMTIATAFLPWACRDQTTGGRATVGGRTFRLEVVDTGRARNRGLGGRHHIPEDFGMLFVFGDSELREFYMKDCHVPIDIAFLDASGRILATHAMPVEPDPSDPQRLYLSDGRVTDADERTVTPAPQDVYGDGRSRYALEVAGGTWAKLGVKPGDRVVIEGVHGVPAE